MELLLLLIIIIIIIFSYQKNSMYFLDAHEIRHHPHRPPFRMSPIQGPRSSVLCFETLGRWGSADPWGDPGPGKNRQFVENYLVYIYRLAYWISSVFVINFIPSYIYIYTGWRFEPLWKIWKSVGMIIPNRWKNNIHGPNHQPDTTWYYISHSYLWWKSCHGSFPSQCRHSDLALLLRAKRPCGLSCSLDLLVYRLKIIHL